MVFWQVYALAKASLHAFTRTVTSVLCKYDYILLYV